MVAIEILKRAVSFLVITSAMSSCTFEKRMYMSGYNVEWSRALSKTGNVKSESISKASRKTALTIEPVGRNSAEVIPSEVHGSVLACADGKFIPVAIAEMRTFKHVTQLPTAREESRTKISASSQTVRHEKVKKRAFESYGIVYFLLGIVSFLLMLLTYYAVLAIVNEIASQQ